MFKNPWFTLVLGLMLGLAVGYVLAEMQPVPPARAMTAGPAAAGSGLPEGHPPVSGQDPRQAQLASRSQELQQLVEQSPNDPRPMVALGNLHFDASDWATARTWYEKAIAAGVRSPDVFTDLAVVHRNLKQPERALELLDQAIAMKADHWQAWHNRVVVLNFDLHRHDEAAVALARLRELKESDPSIPDISGLEQQILEHQ
jgi:tetratricopeptide (TPR) repeat protein